MTPAEIKFELEKLEITQKDIANRTGTSQPLICQVIKGKSVSDPIMKAISKILGKDHRLVFPGYYLNKKRRKKVLKSA